MKKMTKRDMFETVKKAFETGEFDLVNEVIAFCDKEIESLDTKAVKAKERAAAKKAEADVLMDQVREALTDEYQTIADIAATVSTVNADATVSKVQYRLTKLIEADVAEKTQITLEKTEGSKARRVMAYRVKV